MLHVVGARAGSGAEHQVRLLVNRLTADSEVVTLTPPAPALTGLRADGTLVHEVDARDDRDLGAVGRLRGLARHGSFDVVHTHLFRACVLGGVAARLAGVPHVVATEYHADEDERPAAGVRTLYRAGDRRGRVTLAVSAAVAGRVRARGVPAERVVVVPKAVDAAEFRYDPRLRAAVRARLHIPRGTPVIGGVGRLEPRKCFDVLIRAVATVPGAILLLVGDGPARSPLERLAAIEGVGDRVLFAGTAPHAREMLCAMDVFVSPARQTCGLAVLEAIAAGLPALYAACAPLETLATARATVHGTRRLTPHDPESLPRALRAEVLCLAERHEARLPARSAGDRYDAGTVAAAVDQIYDRLAGVGAPGPPTTGRPGGPGA